MSLARSLGGGTFALVGLTACPLTDGYFIDRGQPSGQSGSGGAQAQAGASVSPGGVSSLAGGGAAALDATGGTPIGGAEGGNTAASCVTRAERCNGQDDNCDDVVDEAACDRTLGCTGFAISLERGHGYMFCSGHKNWAQAQAACTGQDMRLVSLETSAEGDEFAQALEALATDDVWFGANDQAVEDAWVWDGGTQFWQGSQAGSPVGGAFVAWANASPDDSNSSEDCAIINPKTRLWADRSCAGNHPYVCEDTTP